MRIDVILPVRDPRREWLLECLESLSAQVDVVPRVIVVLHPKNASFLPLVNGMNFETTVVWAPEQGNIADALNTGLRCAVEPLIARIDADDLAEPYRLACQVQHMHANPGVVALGSAVTTIDETGRIVGKRSCPTNPSSTLRRLRWRNALFHPSVMMRRAVVEKVGGYRPETAGAEDYDLWLRMSAHGTIYSLDQALTRYRLHDHQVSRRYGLAPAVVAGIGESRLALAAARGERLMAASLRQITWRLRQSARRRESQ